MVVRRIVSWVGWGSIVSDPIDPVDNAVAESFFGSLKNEWVNYEDYKKREQARQSIFEYIEIFYNRQRRHAALDYMTPVEYETRNACN